MVFATFVLPHVFVTFFHSDNTKTLFVHRFIGGFCSVSGFKTVPHFGSLFPSGRGLRAVALCTSVGLFSFFWFGELADSGGGLDFGGCLSHLASKGTGAQIPKHQSKPPIEW